MIGSSNIGFGTINSEISWPSNRTNTYMVNAGPTGATVQYTTTNSLFGWISSFVVVTDYLGRLDQFEIWYDNNDGSYGIIATQTSCESFIQGTGPTGGILADPVGGVDWSSYTTFYNGFGYSAQYDVINVPQYSSTGSGNFSALCYNPPFCYVQSAAANTTPSPSMSGTPTFTGMTTFYIGQFMNKDRHKRYTLSTAVAGLGGGTCS